MKRLEVGTTVPWLRWEQGFCQAAQVEDVRNFYYTGHGCPSDATIRQRSRRVETLPGSMASEFLGSGFERFGVKGLAPLGYF